MPLPTESRYQPLWNSSPVENRRISVEDEAHLYNNTTLIEAKEPGITLRISHTCVARQLWQRSQLAGMQQDKVVAIEESYHS